MDGRRATIRGAAIALVSVSLLVNTSGVPAQGYFVSAAPSGLGMPKSTGNKQAALAIKLATDIYRARTAKARYQAVLAVMRAIPVGVYTGNGKPVVRGPERTWEDFYLYVPEVQAMAGGEARHLRSPVAALAQVLAVFGVQYRGAALTDVTLTDLLVRATHWAVAHPGQRVALVGLLVRALGLLQTPRQDPARGVSPSALQLDPLQQFLIVSDILQGRSRKAASLYGKSQAHRPTRSGNCGGTLPEHPDTRGTGWGWFDATVGVAFAAVGPATGTDDTAAVLVAATEVMNAGVPVQHTHYGPPGIAPDAGKVLEWKIQVIFSGLTAQPVAINCGALAGVTFPAAGPIPNVKVTFNTSQEPDIQRYGILRRGASSDANGVGSLTFTPDDEVFPGFGSEVTAKGTFAASVDWSTVFPGLPQRYVSLLSDLSVCSAMPCGQFARDVPERWEVSRHAPRGFKFEGVHFQMTRQDGLVIAYGIAGSVCGEDPYVTPWNQTWVTTEYFPKGGSVEASRTGTVSIPKGGGEVITSTTGRVRFQLLPGPPVQMKATLTPTVGYPATSPTEVTVPLTDDQSCPPPTP